MNKVRLFRGRSLATSKSRSPSHCKRNITSSRRRSGDGTMKQDLQMQEKQFGVHIKEDTSRNSEAIHEAAKPPAAVRSWRRHFLREERNSFGKQAAQEGQKERNRRFSYRGAEAVQRKVEAEEAVDLLEGMEDEAEEESEEEEEEETEVGEDESEDVEEEGGCDASAEGGDDDAETVSGEEFVIRDGCLDEAFDDFSEEEGDEEEAAKERGDETKDGKEEEGLSSAHDERRNIDLHQQRRLWTSDSAESSASTLQTSSTTVQQRQQQRLSKGRQTAKEDTKDSLEGKKSGPLPQSSRTRSSSSNEKNALLDTKTPWGDLSLSRPLLHAIKDLNYLYPTRIQTACMGPALQGRDILANAQTGSGKTAAFLLPALERLLRSPGVRSRKMGLFGPTGGLRGSKVLVLLPTRELAMQCVQMLQCLSKYTPITHALACGGMTLKMQEAALRRQPDIIIATPGRILDLLLNSLSVHLELLEIVILDEADRLLELGFREEILEILRHSHRAHQTLLFSATLTPSIASLAMLALKTPLHISASATVTEGEELADKSGKAAPSSATAALKTVSTTLQQQFVVLHSEQQRAAALLHLCTTAYVKNVIIFFPTKRLAHHTSLLFKLFGLNVAELHGNLTQQMRVEALEKFHSGEADFLLASELASRGLDIAGVECVINYQLPQDVDRYIHSVGRTARMGKTGVAITLYNRQTSERLQVRRLLRALHSAFSPPCIAAASCGKEREQSALHAKVLQRTIDSAKLQTLEKQVEKFQGKIAKILKNERLEKELRLADMQLKRAENFQNYADEIYSRPMRQWFITEKEKQKLKDLSKSFVGKNLDDEEPELRHEKKRKTQTRVENDKDRKGEKKKKKCRVEEQEESADDDDAESDWDGAKKGGSINGKRFGQGGKNKEEVDDVEFFADRNGDGEKLPDWITACSDEESARDLDNKEERATAGEKASSRRRRIQGKEGPASGGGEGGSYITIQELNLPKKMQRDESNSSKTGHKKVKKSSFTQGNRLEEFRLMKRSAKSAKRGQKQGRVRYDSIPSESHTKNKKKSIKKKRKVASKRRIDNESVEDSLRSKSSSNRKRHVKHAAGKKSFKSKGRYKRRR